MKRVILIADDSSTVRKFVSFSLKLHKYDVIAAVDGMDALEKMTQNRVDMAIVDLNMPNMDGFELIEAIRTSEDYDNLPIVILSSERSEESRERAREVGADAYLFKPFDSKMLQYQVVKFLND